MNYLNFFPSESEQGPRTGQVEILQRLSTAFSSGKKFVFIAAPTGSGKSYISKTLANSSADPSEAFVQLIRSNAAFKQDVHGDFVNESNCLSQPNFGGIALTITKNLQDQYSDQFEDTGILKGKNNYTCAIDPKYSVDIAPCIYLTDLKEECLENNKCPYYSARNETLVSKFASLNYSMFLSLPDHVKRREYLICDEASKLEEELVKRFTREIDYKTLQKLNIDPAKVPVSNYSKFRTWLENFLETLTGEIHEIQKRLKKSKNDVSSSERQRYAILTNMHLSVQLTVETWKDCEYLVERTEHFILIRPLRVDKLSKHLFDHADKVVLMSAFFVDLENTAKMLGIKEYEYIEIDSTFDAKRAPIYCTSKVKLNYKNLKDNLPRIAQEIRKICNHHDEVKGIIHTHTMEITNFLRTYFRGEDRFLIRGEDMNNEQLIDAHVSSEKPTTIISPSLTYGVDLKDDLARFQIIVKAAYMPMGDERVKRLFKEEPDWYADKMLDNLIQSCGRGIRSSDDYCVTYILDGSITDAVIRHKAKLPKYFLRRFV